MEKFSLKADFVVKELFAHEKIRKQFLSDVLGIPFADIKSVYLANTFLRKLFRLQKQGVLDVVMVLNDETKVDVEMQVDAQKHWTKRNLFYLGRMYTDDLMIGENYEKLRRCVSISLLDFKLFPNDVEYHHIYRLRDEVDMLMIKNEGMREAVEVVREMGLIRTLRWVYDDYWKAKRDRWARDEYVRDEGIAIGMERGKAEGKAEDILHLLENKDEKEALSVLLK